MLTSSTKQHISIEFIATLQFLYFFNNRAIRKIISDNYDFLQLCSRDEFIEFLSTLSQYVYNKSLRSYTWGNTFKSVLIQKALLSGEKACSYLNANTHIKVLQYTDKNYPRIRLDVLEDDAPVVLYCVGNVDAFMNKSIAIIGTREPDQEYIEPGTSISSIFAKNSYTIVSGLALGCDTLGHNGALNVNGLTVAVLANGLETVYPKQNQELASRIINNNGCLVTEYPPFTRIEKWYFSQRDRLQAALSDMLFVIATGEKGGTLITVDYAIKQKKPIYTFIPIQKTPKSYGNQILIDQKKAIGISVDNREKILEFVLTHKNDMKHDKKINSFLSNRYNKRTVNGFINYIKDEYCQPKLFEDLIAIDNEQIKERVIRLFTDLIDRTEYSSLDELFSQLYSDLSSITEIEIEPTVTAIVDDWLMSKEKRYK